MPKAYWIAHVTVTDPDPYKRYAEGATAVFPKYGARVLARGGAITRLEGAARPRNVVIEFPDMATALACWNSAEYQEARAHRIGAGEADILIVEGVA